MKKIYLKIGVWFLRKVYKYHGGISGVRKASLGLIFYDNQEVWRKVTKRFIRIKKV